VDPTAAPDQTYLGLEHIGVGTLHLVGSGHSGNVVSTCFAFRSGDILFGRLRPYFRKVVQANQDGLCSTELWVLQPSPNVDPDYLFYLLADPRFIAQCTASAEGTRMPRARWDFVAGLEVQLPSPAAQRALGGALATLDRRLGAAREENRTLEALIRASFQAHSTTWLVKGRLDDLASQVRRVAAPHTLAADTPTVGLADFDGGQLALERWGSPRGVRSDKLHFAASDVLFGRLRPALRKVAIAPVAGVCSTDILVLRPAEPQLHGTLAGWMSSPALARTAIALCTGTRMPRVSWDVLARTQVPFPNMAERARWQGAAQPLLARLCHNTLLSRSLAACRDQQLERVLPQRS
jgi:type I restriction enzyme, S subunit